jgi:hypothetical protein
MRRCNFANVRKARSPFQFDHKAAEAAFLQSAAEMSAEARQMLVDVLEEMGADRHGEAYLIELRMDPRLEQLATTLREDPALMQLAVRASAQVPDRITTRAPAGSRERPRIEHVGLADGAFLGAAYLASPSARAAIVRTLDEIGAGRVGEAYRVEFRLDARLEQLAAQLREHPQFEQLERTVALLSARNA